MKNLLTRSITGILFVAVIIAATWYSAESFRGLVLIITILSLSEFYRLVCPNAFRRTLYADILGGTYLVGVLFIIFAYPVVLPVSAVMLILIPYMLYLFYTFIIRLYLKEENPIASWGASLLGQLYIALPLGLLALVAYPPVGAGSAYNARMALAFFSFIWINDTGAYVVGCTLGRHRLFERISPKKSWEGFFGGFIFCLLLGWVWSRYCPLMLDLWRWLGFAVVVSLFSTFGDLCESLLKRTLQVKDSGSILPGHGGMLDRFDSVFLAAPAAAVYLTLVLSI